MIFKVGDICTYNRFEVRIESIDEIEKKVEISYAVFVNEERVFDSNDCKIVPMNRVKLAHRQFQQFGDVEQQADQLTPKSTTSRCSVESLTFSVRQARFHIKTPNETGLVRKQTKSRKRRKNKVRTPKLVLGESESGSDRQSRVRKSPRRVPKRIARISIFSSSGSSPVRIVPDSYLDTEDSSSDESSSSSFVSETSEIDNSESQFSQEREAMRRLATSYERRSAAEANHIDEVEFVDWDPRTKRVIGGEPQFVVVDESDDPRRRSSVTPPAGRIEDIVEKFSLPDITQSTAASDGQSKNTSTPPMDDYIGNKLWKYIDSIHTDWTRINCLIDSLNTVLVSVRSYCSGNTATDLRMILTSGPMLLKSHFGYFAAFYTTLWFTFNLKKSLFPRIVETLFEKFSLKMDTKIIFIMSYLTVITEVIIDSPITNMHIVSILSSYSNQGAEIQKLIRVFSLVVIDCAKKIFGQSMIVELLPFLSNLVSLHVCPKPVDVTVSINERLTESFVDEVCDFIIENFPPVGGLVLIRCGGLIPSVSAGSSILSFSKLKGKNFQSVLRYERGFCDWAERLTDPFSAECVDFIDFVCLDRYWCCLGPRTLKADVEYLRLGKENVGIDQVELWLRNRGLICGKILNFFCRLAMKFEGNKNCLEYVSYAQCAYNVFAAIADLPVVDEIETSLVLPKPRGEFVKEVIRPLIRLGDIFPVLKKRIRDGILGARAKAYGCSIEVAEYELRSFHGITV